MSAYAIGHLRNVTMGPPVVDYLEHIDATLAPYGGRFAIHGARPEVLEGDWTGDLVAIEFPDLDRARAWYRSDAYQRLVPLRADNSESRIFLVDGASPDHRATDILHG